NPQADSLLLECRGAHPVCGRVAAQSPYLSTGDARPGRGLGLAVRLTPPARERLLHDLSLVTLRPRLFHPTLPPPSRPARPPTAASSRCARAGFSTSGRW